MKKHYYLLSFTIDGGDVKTKYLGVDQPRITMANIMETATKNDNYLGYCTAVCYLGEMTHEEFNNWSPN
ncbi:hypothetical protein [Pseudomonas cremoricolorata]|uniref:hypothetical protein n=1 Tax=Pseudomonas cremoricolorata TaxID=157783 RepID=UPI00048D376A|nr:hypothetical protein [Pseudomonas cremoricolorata]